MTDAGFFRGTSADQDNRFANKQKKLLKELNFSPILNTKLIMSKIDINALKPWIEDRIKNVLEKDDELLSESIYEHLAEKEPDGKNILVLITGFVDEIKASKFMEELWAKLIDLQDNSNGLNKICENSDQEPKSKEETSSEVAGPSEPNKDGNKAADGGGGGDNPKGDQRDRRSSSRSSHSVTPPSRSVSKSPGGSHKLDEKSRGRQRRRPQDDQSNGSRSPASEKDRSRSRSGSRGSKKSADGEREARQRSKSSSRSRSKYSGSRSGSRSSYSRSRSASRSRSRSRSPRHRPRSPYHGGGHSFRGQRSRSRSHSRGYRPRSRSPRGRRGFGRGPYRGGSFGYHDRRRGMGGPPMRRRPSPWGRRRFSPRSPVRRRRTPSMSPRRARSPTSPYDRRRSSRSRSPPGHMLNRNPHSHAPLNHIDAMGPRHVPHQDMMRSIGPVSRSPRGMLDHRGYHDAPLLPRHHSPPGLAHNKALEMQPTYNLTNQPIASGSGMHSPPSSGRKKHKKEKKHKKHKKSSKKHGRDKDSESPDRRKKKHKKHKKTKKHK